MKSVITSLVILIVFATTGCKKENNRANYPPVNQYLNITLVQYNSLAVPGGWTYANGGLKGIIVYRKSSTEFIAFDRNCTYNEANSCGKAEVESDNVTISCACDGSTYNIFDGSVTTGPASFALKVYNTSFNSSNNTLRVFN